MKHYEISHEDIFCFEEKSEMIVHLSDFAFATLKPSSVLIAAGDIEIAMRVVGAGNQQGKLMARLATEDDSAFSDLRRAVCDEQTSMVTLSFET